jgi:hypothetical protein
MTTESDEIKKATYGYNASINLWILASPQIFNRFATMLTANSIVIAVISVLISRLPQIQKLPTVLI